MKRSTKVFVSLAATAATVLGLAAPAFAAATVSSTTLTTGIYASSSVYSPDGKTIAVATFGDAFASPPVESEVDFIDVATNTVTPVTDAAIVDAAAVVWSPDGTLVYVLNYDSDIAVIDVATHTVVDTLGAGASSTLWGMSITPDGNFLVVGDYTTSNSSAIVDIANNTYVTLSYNTDSTVATFVSPDGSKAYLVDYYGAVSVFDLTDPTYPLLDTLQFDGMSSGGTSVCSSFDMSTLYMVDYNEAPFDAYLSRLDLATGASTSVATTNGESIGCNMTPDGKNVLVASYGGDVPGSVLEFDGSTLALVNSYTTSATDYTDVIASSPLTCDVYVSNYEPTTNILNFDCSPQLPNTGVDVVAMAAAGGFAAVAIVAGIVVLVIRRRKA